MMGTDYQQSLDAMRGYYNSGVTLPISFRKQQLRRLKDALQRYEQEIYDALLSDLKKSPEETYATETGLVLAEITVMLKHLNAWAKPQRAKTNFLNFPSSSKIHYDPLGVTLIIAPWNYPLQLLFIPLVGAISGGNCAVLKPSEFAPATAAITAKIIAETFPPEYVQVVLGDGATVIPALMQGFRFDHIFYTGSGKVGSIIYQAAAKELIPVTLELGGKSPAIVEADANIAVAARRIISGKFTNAGQTCIAPDYLLVQEGIADALIAELEKTITAFFGTDAKQSHDYGRIISSGHFNRLAAFLNEGTIITGGDTDPAQLYIAPTLLDHVKLSSPVMQEEIFGPLLPIIRFKTHEEAAAIVQQNHSPLAFYLFTSDKKKEQEWITKTSFGGACVNNTLWHFANHHLPFGGVRGSGMGVAHGKYSFLTFTHAKPVMKTPVWFDPSVKYPPYLNKLKIFKRLIR